MVVVARASTHTHTRTLTAPTAPTHLTWRVGSQHVTQSSTTEPDHQSPAISYRVFTCLPSNPYLFHEATILDEEFFTWFQTAEAVRNRLLSLDGLDKPGQKPGLLNEPGSPVDSHVISTTNMEDLTSDILVNADDGSPLPDLDDREDEQAEPGTGDRTQKKRRGFRGLLKTASLQDRLLDK